MNCNDCKHNVLNESVPRSVYESSQAQANVNNRRLFIALLLTIILFVASNLAWIIYESQFTDEYIEVTQENESGYNSYIGRDGDIHNGETDGQNQETDP